MIRMHFKMPGQEPQAWRYAMFAWRAAVLLLLALIAHQGGS